MPNATRPATVLIIEDEIIVALDIERVLIEAGYNVVAIATDREEARKVADKVDLAFVDVNLRDGPTGPFIALDLAQAHGTRVVYVTANPKQIEPRAETAIGFVRKPFTDAAILAAAAVATNRSPPEAGLDALTLFERPIAS